MGKAFDALRSALLDLELSDLPASEITARITESLVVWARAHAAACLLEVPLPFLYSTPEYPMRQGYLDALVELPGRPPCAIEIDRSDKRWSLRKLEYARLHGYGALWIRWGTPVRVSVPDGVVVLWVPARRLRSTTRSNRPERGAHSPAARALVRLVLPGLASGSQLADEEAIWAVVDGLPGRLSHVVSLRSGRYGGPLTLAGVARHVHRMDGGDGALTRERIRQLEVKALRMLRHPSRRRRLALAEGGMPIPKPGAPAVDQHGPHRAVATVYGIDVVGVLEAVGRPLRSSMITHLLRGSQGPVAAGLAKKHAVARYGAYRSLPFREVHDQVVDICRRNPQLGIVDGRCKLLYSSSSGP